MTNANFLESEDQEFTLMVIRCESLLLARKNSNVADADRLPQAGDRVAPRPRRVFVGHVAGEPQVRDDFGQEAVIQLLSLVQLVPARIAARVEMADIRTVDRKSVV